MLIWPNQLLLDITWHCCGDGWPVGEAVEAFPVDMAAAVAVGDELEAGAKKAHVRKQTRR